jgi:hypothetical protein
MLRLPKCTHPGRIGGIRGLTISGADKLTEQLFYLINMTIERKRSSIQWSRTIAD